MTKHRKIKRGNFVKYAGHEWIVKDKKKKKYQLVRRQVVVGHTIWAPKEKIKLADQTWRSELRTGDPINLFIGGIWTSASVLRREGSTLCIQPCFNNFTIRLNQNGMDYFDYHHTPDDTLDKIDPEELKQNVAAYVVAAYLAADADADFRLPVKEQE